jgi:beta-galactosidase
VRRLLSALLAAPLLLLVAGASEAGARDVPEGFQWGVAIAGFQTEMGRDRDIDRGSDWWAWTHDRANITAGRVTSDRPERGPGFFARYRQDVDLAARDLHLNAFRLGIEWSRIFPRSTAQARTLAQLDRLADKDALERYRSILERIRTRGMTPWVTLNHFTLPLWISDPIAAREAFAKVGPDDPPPTGFGPRGWLDRSTVTEFAKYARYLAWKLGDVVDDWITLNEPVVVTTNGYVNVPGVLAGNFPPGVFSFTAARTVLRRLADANAAAYDAIKAQDSENAGGGRACARVGFVHNMIAFTPADPSSSADVRGTDHADYLFNRLFLDSVVKGYRDNNADGRITASERNRRRAGKADFIGVNYYFRGRVTGQAAPLTPVIPVLDFLPATTYRTPSTPTAPPCPTTCTDFGWEIYPRGFRRVLATAGAYGLPIYVTENGISDADDDQRPDYLRSHLRAMRDAIRAKEADVRGYFHWSLTDNFEWAVGYNQKFGLYAFDAQTLARTARPSASLYARIARTGRIP